MYRYLFYLLLLINFQILNLKAYVYIIVAAHNKPEFIELQYRTFKKFLVDEYKYVIFNDASDSKIFKDINEICRKLEIQCYTIPKDLHKGNLWTKDYLKLNYSASFNHGEVIRYAFDKIGFAHNDIVVLMDSDCFLIHEFSIKEYLGDYAIAGRKLYKEKVHPAADLIFFNMPILPRPQSMIFEAGMLGYKVYDTCYFLEFYLKAFPEVKVKYMSYENIIDLAKYSNETLYNLGFTNDEIDFIKDYKNLYDNNGSSNSILWKSAIFEKKFINFIAGRDLGKISQLKLSLFKDFIMKITN